MDAKGVGVGMAAILPDGPRGGARQDMGCFDPLLPIGRRCMPVAPTRAITLTAAERKRLKKMAYGHKTEYRLRMRAQIVLHAEAGRSNARIARETGLHLDTVRCWRGRFAEHGIAGLSDRKRSGRPPVFTALQVAEVKALACQLPAETGMPSSRWLSGTGPRGGRPGHRRIGLRLHRAALAQGRRAQALAVPVVGLHPRPGLPRQGRPHHGPVRPHR
ncbi:helix-turn-helix domain-containing protein [Streptomyces sp. CG1]|uniref:helix-turn-helix domain-containing protein n=1 Tax=Streptomyces sp. CG1 TaxID=1287523 RepID=UPI0034E2AE28